MAKRKSRAPVGAGSAAKVFTPASDDLSIKNKLDKGAFSAPAAPAAPEQFFLHVTWHGVEHRIPIGYSDTLYGPPKATLLVKVQDGYEITVTRNIFNRGHFTPIFSVPPRGAGWQVLDESSDKWTSWRRPVGTAQYVKGWLMEARL